MTLYHLNCYVPFISRRIFAVVDEKSKPFILRYASQKEILLFLN